MSDNEELLPCQCFPSSPSVHPPDNKICVACVVGDNGGGRVGVIMAVLEVMIYPNPPDNKICVACVDGDGVSCSGGGGGVVMSW